jgi:hypothetical protein
MADAAARRVHRKTLKARAATQAVRYIMSRCSKRIGSSAASICPSRLSNAAALRARERAEHRRASAGCRNWSKSLVAAKFFADRAPCKLAKNRIVTAEEIIHQSPDIIIGSWCGKKFRPEKVAQRAGFDCIPAVKHGALHEIKSSLILQRGPAALTNGLAALQAIIVNAIKRAHLIFLMASSFNSTDGCDPIRRHIKAIPDRAIRLRSIAKTVAALAFWCEGYGA